MFLLLLLIILFLLGFGFVQQRRLTRKRRQSLLRQLHKWLGTQQAGDPQLRQWVNGLSATESEVLLDLLTGYCSSLNWELNWLFAPHLQKVPTLKQAIEEGVMAYMRSILASLQVVDEVETYRAYVALMRKPLWRKQSSLMQKLYQAMSAQGVIMPLAQKRRWFRRLPTHKQKVALITAAFDRQPLAAMNSLKSLLTAEAETDFQQILVTTSRMSEATN